MSGLKSGAGLVCAVDGGGTKTVAIVCDPDGREFGRSMTGSSNYVAGEIDRVVDRISDAVREATAAADSQLPLHSLWIGLAGIDRPGARALLLPYLQKFANEVRLTNDAQLVFGALAGEIGVVLIAGTGSIALGADQHGTVVRASGWGYLIGDEGSGYDLGRRALQAVARAADGRAPATALLDEVTRAWELTQPLDLIDRVYQTTEKADIADLSSLVLDVAAAGDPVASQIVDEAASELAAAAVAVASRLDLSPAAVPLALAGGLLVHRGDYRQLFLQKLAATFPSVDVVVVPEPAYVAARQLASKIPASLCPN